MAITDTGIWIHMEESEHKLIDNKNDPNDEQKHSILTMNKKLLSATLLEKGMCSGIFIHVIALAQEEIKLTQANSWLIMSVFFCSWQLWHAPFMISGA